MAMLSYLAGSDVTLMFDLSNIGMTPVSAVYRVIDGDGNNVVAPTSVSILGSPTPYVSVVVAALSNVLPVDVHAAWNTVVQPTSMARTVYLTVTGTGAMSGTVSLDQSYRVVAQDRLLAPQNTFQTLAAAVVLGMDIPNLPDWDSASDQDRVSALMEARNRIGRLTFRYQPDDWQSRVSPWLSVHDFDEMNPVQWAATDYLFKTALRRAQVLEANDVISDRKYIENSMEGVTSIKIGDSERHFNHIRKGRFVLCPRALQVLSKFIGYKRMGRS